MHPDNTVICQVKIRAAMKAAQEAAKRQKHLQRKENNFFNSRKRSLQLALFMLIIFCNGKERSKLIIPFLSIRAPISQYKTRLLLLSVVSFLSTLFGYIKKDATSIRAI
jgi:hypothetical protein